MGIFSTRWLLVGAVGAVGAAMVAAPSSSAAGSSPLLIRYPYLTDLTATSVQVTWATTNTGDAATAGLVTWGSVGSACMDGQSVAATSSYSAFGSTYLQHSARMGAPAGDTSALSPGTS